MPVIKIKLQSPVSQFGFVFFAFTAIWYFFLNWDGSSLLCGGDSALELLYYREVLEQRGLWTQLLYNEKILGGTLFHGLFGTPLFSQVFAALGLAPTMAYNLTHLLIQTMVAFLGVEIIRAIAGPREKISTSGLLRWALWIIVGFNPTIMWRLGWGHQNFISALLAILALAYLCTNRRGSHFLLFLAWIGLCQGLTSLGQQLLIYSIFFFSPLFFVLARQHWRDNWKRNVFLIGSACMLALPQNVEMFRVAISQDARSALDPSAIYSYIVGTWRDIFGFFFLNPSLTTHRTDIYLFHEIHYYLGPFVLGLAWIWKRRERALFWSLLYAIGALTILALNIKPLSDVMLNIFPLIGGLRTPLRGFIILTTLLEILSLAVLSRQDFNSKLNLEKRFVVLIAVVGIGLALTLGGWQSEIVLWLIAGILVVTTVLQKETLFIPVVLSIAAAAFVNNAALIVSRGPSFAEVEEEPRQISAKIHESDSRLQDGLWRASTKTSLRTYRNNTLWSLNIPSVDGYFSAPQRLVRMFVESRGIDYLGTISNLRFTDEMKDFGVYRQLYNICCEISLGNSENLVHELSATNGPAWFGFQLAEVSDWKELHLQLKSYADQPEAFRHKLLFINESTNGMKAVGRTNVSALCEQAQVMSVQKHKLHYESPADCPLVLSLNYSSLMNVTTDSGKTHLKTFPVFGTLTGISVPAGKGTLSWKVSPLFPGWLIVLCYVFALGLLLLGVYQEVNDE